MSTDEEKNEMMVRVAPELASSWAKCPLRREYWLDLSATIENDNGTQTPAFIAHKKDPNFPTPLLKEDYVWGAGPRGYGYYHLLTRESYVALNARVKSNRPSLNCCCFGSAQENEDWDVVSDIVYNRSVSPKPDDIVAYKAALNNARFTSEMTYNTTQNIQLVMMLH